MTEPVQVLINNHNTSHGWHFIATLLTTGAWALFWIMFTMSNAIERGKIKNQIKDLLASQEE